MKEDAVCSLGGITIVNVKTLEQKKMLEKIVVSLTSF
jgi:pyrroline-5-carboxylate reductase